MTKFESDIKVIPFSSERVFEKLSDLNNLETIKDKLPQDKIQDLVFDQDSISFTISPVGNLNLQIIEREPHKCIKFETIASPLPFNMWIQIVSTNDTECKIKVTIGMELNPFMKTMVQKPLKEGLEKMVTMLSLIQY